MALLYSHFRRFLTVGRGTNSGGGGALVGPHDIDVYASPLSGYRLRVRFGVLELPGHGLTYAEFEGGVRSGVLRAGFCCCCC